MQSYNEWEEDTELYLDGIVDLAKVNMQFKLLYDNAYDEDSLLH